MAGVMTRARDWRLALVALVLSLAVVEMLGRVVLPRQRQPFVPSTNPRLIYELNPSYPEINSFGMRQEEFDPATLRGQFVIAVIGDSHTYGSNATHRALTFPARLQHHLRAQTGQTVTVLNFGVPGYGMVQELEVLRAVARRFEPDLVILQYCINDDHISNFIQPTHPWLNRLMHSSVVLTSSWTSLLYSDFGRQHLLTHVEDHAPELLLYVPGLVGTPVSRERNTSHGPTHPTRSRDLVPVRYHDFIGRENLERAVGTFGAVLAEAGIPALATGFIEEPDRALYLASGFQVHSFFDMFVGLDMRRYGYDPAQTDGHFAGRGNDLIGQALADYAQHHYSLAPRPVLP